MNQDQVQTQASKLSTAKSLLDTAIQNVVALDDQLRHQLMYNIDQVFHLNGTKISDSDLEILKTRQQTLVAETLRRILGRSKSAMGGLREALNILNREKP